jgi:23S rRNA (pseudouridine1915-N3)-methyltransferase
MAQALSHICRPLADVARQHTQMKIALVSITKRRGSAKQGAVDELVAEYLKRTSRYCVAESREFAEEAALWKNLERAARTAPVVVALDSRGKQMSSEELAAFIGQHLERGTQELVFAIGPADGWSQASLERAAQRLSLGRMTLPHELARVVMAEQLYRAFAILNHHPYHGGH